MLADPLTKGLLPNVFKEHLAGMGYGKAYESLIVRAQKSSFCFESEMCIVAVNLMVLTVVMRHALCANL